MRLLILLSGVIIIERRESRLLVQNRAHIVLVVSGLPHDVVELSFIGDKIWCLFDVEFDLRRHFNSCDVLHTVLASQTMMELSVALEVAACQFFTLFFLFDTELDTRSMPLHVMINAVD